MTEDPKPVAWKPEYGMKVISDNELEAWIKAGDWQIVDDYTAPLYDRATLDAAIAHARREERALWTEAVMTELDGNGQAFAILAAVIGSALADKQEGA